MGYRCECGRKAESLEKAISALESYVLFIRRHAPLAAERLEKQHDIIQTHVRPDEAEEFWRQQKDGNTSEPGPLPVDGINAESVERLSREGLELRRKVHKEFAPMLHPDLTMRLKANAPDEPKPKRQRGCEGADETCDPCKICCDVLNHAPDELSEPACDLCKDEKQSASSLQQWGPCPKCGGRKDEPSEVGVATAQNGEAEVSKTPADLGGTTPQMLSGQDPECSPATLLPLNPGPDADVNSGTSPTRETDDE